MEHNGKLARLCDTLGHDKFYGIRETQAFANPVRMGSEHSLGGLSKAPYL